MEKIFGGVFKIGQNIATLNAVPGKKVYGERLERKDEEEYRIWDVFRSKLAGAIMKGLINLPFYRGSIVLYLGASTGTTISHISDIIGEKGEIYSVEMSPQCMKSLLQLCEERENMIPIHADARKPADYAEVGKVDVIYQDVAQPDQDDILMKNARMFLKNRGIAMICIKSQSIDVTKKPEKVYKTVLDRLKGSFEVLEKIRLDPYDKDHMFVVLRYNEDS